MVAAAAAAVVVASAVASAVASVVAIAVARVAATVRVSSAMCKCLERATRVRQHAQGFRNSYLCVEI